MSYEKTREYPLSTLEVQVRSPIRAVDWKALVEQQHYQYEKSGHKCTPLIWPHGFIPGREFGEPPGTDFLSLLPLVENDGDHGPDLDEVAIPILEHRLPDIRGDYRIRVSGKGTNIAVVIGFYIDGSFEDEISFEIQGVDLVNGAVETIPAEWFDLSEFGYLDARVRCYVITSEEPGDPRLDWVSVYADEVNIEQDLKT